MFKIAVLICGDPMDKIKSVKGNYGVFFQRLLEEEKETIEENKMNLQFSSFECFNDQFPTNEFCNDQDLFIISGSKFRFFFKRSK